MRGKALIIFLLLFLTGSLEAQNRIIKPELVDPLQESTGFFPESGIPFPADSSQMAKAIRFYEQSIENLDGKENSDNQVLILYCIAELNRLNGKYVQALFAFRDAAGSTNEGLDSLARAHLQSRICYTMTGLAETDPGHDFHLPVIQELGFGDFEQLMLNTIDRLEKHNDETNLMAMLSVAFKYYQFSGENAQAYRYGDKLLKYKDYLAGQQLKRKLESLEDELEMDQKNREIQLLENQRILYEEKIKGSARQLWIILLSIGLLLVFAIALFHRIRAVRKTRDLLQAKAAQLQHEKDRARRNELFKEQFLANVSHEIRTPMNAIMGITNILIKNEHPKSQEKYLNAMQESAKNLLVLINDILDLSKLGAGKVELVQTPFNPRDIIDEIYVKMRGRAMDKSLSLRMEVDENIPEILTGDGFVLSNILMNLVMNAITFTIRGGVEIICKVKDQADDRITLLFEVRDTGMGIVPEKQEQILKTFVKVHEKTSVEYEGSGLELAIINQLVELQGGRIGLDSTPGVGTTFFFEIPYRISEDAVISQVETVNPDDCELKDIRVLLVEDNEFNVMVASTELESVIRGLQLDVAGNGKEAIEKLKLSDYHLILMDVQMPVMDGYEATRKIRKMNGSMGRIPIIAMTANILQQEVDKCLREGMNDYISKPFDTNELLGKMKKLLQPAA